MAQNPSSIKFQRIGIEHGLSNNTVNCILQDKDGFIWIGTENGLNRYDGYQFITVGGNDSRSPFASQDIRHLIQDSRGFIWVATFGGGLQKLNPVTWETEVFVNDNLKKWNELGSNNIRKICEDKSGNLWLATDNGLTKFDHKEKKFKIFRRIEVIANSLCFDDVRALCLDEKTGLIWVGTYAGLCNINPETEKITRIPFTKRSLKQSRDTMLAKAVSSLYIDDNERLWIGIYGNFIQYLDLKSNRYFQFLYSEAKDGFKAKAINQTILDDRGRLWMGGWEGLSIFDPSHSNFQNYFFEINNPGSLSSNFIRCILKDRNGMIWLGTLGKGINLYYPDPPNLLIRSNDPGNPSSISSNRISSLHIDAKNRLWVGHEHAYLDSGNFDHNTFGKVNPFPRIEEEFKSEETISKILQDTGYVYDRFGKKFKIYSSDCSIRVLKKDMRWDGIDENEWSITSYVTNEGKLWEGNFTNCYQLDLSNGAYTIFVNNYHTKHKVRSQIGSSQVNDIIEDKHGIIWLATARDLSKYDPSNKRFTNYRFDPTDTSKFYERIQRGEVKKIVDDDAGNIWLGTYNQGLYRFSKARGSFQRYYLPGKNNDGVLAQITSLCYTKKKILYAGTNGGGLMGIHTLSGRVFQITSNQGLVSNTICGILEDDGGNIWVSTPAGLCEWVIPSDLINGKLGRVFTVANGLPSNEFKKGVYCRDNDGRLYFGNEKGVVSFIPGMLVKPSIQAPLRFTGIDLFQYPIRPSDSSGILPIELGSTRQIQLLHFQNYLTIHFAALGFIDLINTRYQYRLLGRSDHWLFCKPGENSIEIDNLSIGTYELQIRASNANFILDSEGKVLSLRILVLPPWYLTGWFKTFCVLVVCVFIFFIYRFQRIKTRLRRNIEQSAIERKLSELSLTALRSRMNPHFIFNTLNSVQAMVRNSETDEAERYIQSLSRLIRQVLETSDKKTVTLEAELDMLKAYVSLEQLRFKDRFDFELSLNGVDEPADYEIPSMILQPFVENAILHAFTGIDYKGHIHLYMTLNGDLLHSVITDNGIGREKVKSFAVASRQHKSVAIGDIGKRLEELNKLSGIKIKLVIEDLLDEQGNPKGTRVILEIPVEERF